MYGSRYGIESVYRSINMTYVIGGRISCTHSVAVYVEAAIVLITCVAMVHVVLESQPCRDN